MKPEPSDAERLWQEVKKTTPCACPLCNQPYDPTRHSRVRAHAAGALKTDKCLRWRRARELLGAAKKPGDSVNHLAACQDPLARKPATRHEDEP
jgi:hypothetical protein